MTKEMIKELDEKLKKLDVAKYLLAIKKKQFEESTIENKKEIETLEKEVEEIKSKLSNEALTHFNETKEKDFVGGIKIKEYETLSYDEKVAFDWCKQKQMFITFDKKSFEKAIDSIGVDFVTKTKEPKTTFPSKLILED